MFDEFLGIGDGAGCQLGHIQVGQPAMQLALVQPGQQALAQRRGVGPELAANGGGDQKGVVGDDVQVDDLGHCGRKHGHVCRALGKSADQHL